MKLKKIINLKYTIMLINITNFRKFESCYELFSNELSWIMSYSVEVVMISQESTTKDVKLVGYDFCGHTRQPL